MNKALISAQGLCKSYGSLEVLREVSLEIYAQEIVSIVGASGAGKTTLLQILGTLLPFDRGSLKIGGQETASLREPELASLRNEKLGFVFQDHGLLPEFTALENAMLPMMIKGEKRSRAEARAKELLHRLGLEERFHHKPAALSGGEKQRVSIARALVNEPLVILADEPTGALDSRNREILEQLFFDLRRELGQTFIVVTHDERFASAMDRSIILVDGAIQEVIARGV